MSVADDLEKLQQLKEKGAISEEEFARSKAKILKGSDLHSPVPGGAPARPGQPQTALAANTPCPPTYMAHAIIATLFCFLPLGIVAIVKASGVTTAWAAGNFQQAEALSKEAKMWVNISVIVGVVLGLIIVVATVA